MMTFSYRYPLIRTRLSGITLRITHTARVKAVRYSMGKPQLSGDKMGGFCEDNPEDKVV